MSESSSQWIIAVVTAHCSAAWRAHEAAIVRGEKFHHLSLCRAKVECVGLDGRAVRCVHALKTRDFLRHELATCVHPALALVAAHHLRLICTPQHLQDGWRFVGKIAPCESTQACVVRGARTLQMEQYSPLSHLALHGVQTTAHSSSSVP